MKKQKIGLCRTLSGKILWEKKINEKEGTNPPVVDYLHNFRAQEFLNKQKYNIGTFSMIQLLLHMRAVVPVAWALSSWV